MINQFEINHYVKKQINLFLSEHNITLKQAMDDEIHNKKIAEILHSGFPKMVQKIYSLPKFEKFLWEKRELLAEHIGNRLEALEQAAAKKAAAANK